MPFLPFSLNPPPFLPPSLHRSSLLLFISAHLRTSHLPAQPPSLASPALRPSISLLLIQLTPCSPSQTKILQKLREEQELSKMEAGDTPLHVMKRLRKQQLQKGQAYAVRTRQCTAHHPWCHTQQRDGTISSVFLAPSSPRAYPPALATAPPPSLP